MNLAPTASTPLAPPTAPGPAARPTRPRLRLLTGRHHRITSREVEAIIATADPVQRNLRITLAYHDITCAMAELVGSDSLVWTAFATWASRTAGRFIRNEYLPAMAWGYLERLARARRQVYAASRLLRRVSPGDPVPPSSVERAVARVATEISRSAMEGNLAVFSDVAPVFLRLIEGLRGQRAPDPDLRARLVSGLCPGPTEDGGQDLLIGAVAAYFDACFERDPKRRAELVLLANNQVGLHEQIRLQPYIHRCLNAPIVAFLADDAHQRADRVASPLRALIDALVDRELEKRRAWLETEWSVIATRFLMRMDLPTISLRLGEDMPPLATHQMFPAALTEIDNPDLRALLYQVDRTPNTTWGSAARNWAEIAERMNFICDLFRTRQQDPSLLQSPFSPAQVVAIRAGAIPDGPL